MNIGLIAHDSKKALMQNFCIAYKGILGKHTAKAIKMPVKTTPMGLLMASRATGIPLKPVAGRAW